MSCDQTRHHTLPSVDSIKYPRGITYRTAPSDWETRWQSHWVPPFLGSIARKDVREGIAQVMRAVALQWLDEQFSARFFTSKLVQEAKRILGPSGDAREWRRGPSVRDGYQSDSRGGRGAAAPGCITGLPHARVLSPPCHSSPQLPARTSIH